MAGRSSRFFAEGYKVPKYMLPFAKSTILQESLRAITEVSPSEKIVLIYRNIHNTRSNLQKMILSEDLNRFNIELFELQSETRGQAQTVYEYTKSILANQLGEEMIIFNADTIHYDLKHHHYTLENSRGYIEVCDLPGDHWSFVEPELEKESRNGSGKARAIIEKRRISNLASNGVYQFKSIEFFNKMYDGAAAEDPENELFVSLIYDFAIREGFTFEYIKISSTKLVFCGTPAEYELAVIK
jgi:hypothetical protein